MQFPDSWLRELVNPKVGVDELTHRLTLAGLQVEGISSWGSHIEAVVVGEVIGCRKHPNANSLFLCQLKIGDVPPLNIVCGATNVRTGLKVPVALCGAILPNDLKIKKSKIRGEVSEGMICSRRELGLVDTTSRSIMELPAEAPVGCSFNEYYPMCEKIISLDVTPNRGDCLSILGIAREVAALFSTDREQKEIFKVGQTKNTEKSISIKAPTACPRYIGRIITQINASAASPLWLQTRLEQCGVRPISVIVDVTNYVMLELGQPLHSFDLDKISGGIQVRYAEEGETLRILDSREITLKPDTLVIADDEGPVAIAGLMGGLDSSVTSETKNIFLESAFFTPEVMAGRGRYYQLTTEASMRFERGVDPEGQRQAMERATELLIEIAGGEVGPMIEAFSEEHLASKVSIHFRRLKLDRVLGESVAEDFIVSSLIRLGCVVQKEVGGWQVVPPSHRFDLLLEDDLIEEVARLWGYDQFSSKMPTLQVNFLQANRQLATADKVRQILFNRGYSEVITYSFIAEEMLQAFDTEKKFIKLQNPIHSEMAVLRTLLWPGLINVLKFNQDRQTSRTRIYEIGMRFYYGQDRRVIQETVVSGLVSGMVCPDQWGLKSSTVDYFDIKNDVFALLDQARLTTDAQFKASQHPALRVGEQAMISLEGRPIGLLGRLHPYLQQSYELKQPVCLFEVQLADLQALGHPEFAILSKFPTVRRDIAVTVDQNVSAEDLQTVIKKQAGDWLTNLWIFDVYEGEGIAVGQKSIAIGLTLQHPSRTLIDEEVNRLMDEVVSLLTKACGAMLRK